MLVQTVQNSEELFRNPSRFCFVWYSQVCFWTDLLLTPGEDLIETVCSVPNENAVQSAGWNAIP